MLGICAAAVMVACLELEAAVMKEILKVHASGLLKEEMSVAKLVMTTVAWSEHYLAV
jgi:hypothetical protein